jgi:hypothetical protein
MHEQTCMGRVQNPNELFQVGETINVSRLKFDRERERFHWDTRSYLSGSWSSDRRAISWEVYNRKVAALQTNTALSRDWQMAVEAFCPRFPRCVGPSALKTSEQGCEYRETRVAVECNEGQIPRRGV